MGDGVLAYFGWPQAPEDEAERAIKAGLALTDRVAKLDTPAGEPLAARVGIATGLVMVGELIGEGAAQEQTVIGETPNLAARLQTLAAPGSVVIGQATQRLVGGLFELADLGPRRAGLADLSGTGAGLLYTQWLGSLAEAHLRAGQSADALAALDQAAETAAATGECYYQAELCRLRGVLLAETGDANEAASSFQQSIDTARSQDAKSLELRAATSLARLWAVQGKRAQARDLLAPVYDWFTEGFDTQDLKDAKALLDELA